MRLYWLELKKLLSSAAVWGFIAACLLFNAYLVISGSGDVYADFVGAAAYDTGYVLNQSFYEKLSRLTAADGQAEYLEQLQYETDGAADVFEGYDTKYIGEGYIGIWQATGPLAQAMRDKYSALQKAVNEKAARDESLTLYFAGATYNRHQQLFNDIMGWLLVEGALLAVLLVFLLVGYESIHKTGDVVYAAKKGRRILRIKMAVSLLAGLGAYVLMALFTLLAYFSLHDYGGTWGSSVSSLFNYRYDIIGGYRPFVTWHSFSVLTYLAATLGMSAGLIVCFSLMAFGLAVLIRNHYIGFFVFLAANAAVIVLPMQMPKTLTISLYSGYYAMLTPVWLWLKHSLWFTDGDVDILWPHFETLGFCVSLLALAAFCLLAGMYFRKRDLT